MFKTKKSGKSFIRPLKRLHLGWQCEVPGAGAGAVFDRLLETEDLQLRGICYRPQL